jgi:hypothetical protein
MKFFVSRQIYWPEGTPVVEVACGGLDYANPDMLCVAFRAQGEGCEYVDPVEAAEAAIAVCKLWRQHGKSKAKVASGATGGMTMPFEPVTFAGLRQWARALAVKLPHCDQCGDLIADKPWYIVDDRDAGDFCSSQCCDRAWENLHRTEEE